MILLPHAKRIAHDFGRGMDLPGLYSGLSILRVACAKRWGRLSPQKAKTRCANSGLPNQTSH